MMQFIFFLLLTLPLSSLGQTRYEWINTPEINDMLDEYQDRRRDYLLLHGNVQEIEQKSSHFGGATAVSVMKYDEFGNLQSIQETTYPENSLTIIRFWKIRFDYDSLHRRIAEWRTEIVEGDTIVYEKRSAKKWFGPSFPKPIAVNEFGHSTIMAKAKDTTFSTYDPFGRKIMDSIPFGRNTEGLKNAYWYYRDSIYCEKVWSARSDVPSEREIYLLDEYGNWIEKRIYWDNDRDYMERFTRTILYREED